MFIKTNRVFHHVNNPSAGHKVLVAVSACILATAAVAGEKVPLLTPAPASSGMPAELGLDQAMVMALTNNRAIRVQQWNPAIEKTYESSEMSIFDPVVSAGVVTEQVQRPDSSLTGAVEDVTGMSLGMSQRLATGTGIDVSIATERRHDLHAEHASKAGITLSQALLKGRPIAVNLASAHQASLGASISAYEFRGFVENLLEDVENTYWECVLAGRRVSIVEKSLSLAEQQLHEVRQRINVGNLPEMEAAAAEAEVALRREALINERSVMATMNLKLVRLVSPGLLLRPRPDFILVTAPVIMDFKTGAVESHVKVAMQMRPDLNQARLMLKRGELELVKTRNGVLPRMDLFVALGDTGYARSFGGSLRNIDGRNVESAIGVDVEIPVGNRASRSLHQRASFSVEQMAESLRNLEDLVRVDVETGILEVNRTREQIVATATTLRLQEEKVRAETVKFHVGRSTALLVAQAQRDLLSSQVGEVSALVRHLQAIVAFFRAEGSLLDRKGITTPGNTPAGD